MQILLAGEKKNATINVDTLHINLKNNFQSQLVEIYKLLELKGEPYYVDNNTSLVINTNIRSNNYKVTIDVKYKDENFAYFHLFPSNAYQKNDLIPFALYGIRFYQDGWTETLKEILSTLNFEIHSISKLHVALDASELGDTFLKYFYTENLNLKSRLKLRGTSDNKTKKYIMDKGIKLGSDYSNWNFTFYPKSKEYIQKPFIKSFHELNGVRGDLVQRCELRLNNSEACKYIIDIHSLEHPNILVGLFKKYTDSKFCFIDRTKYTYHNHNKLYTVVKWLVFPEELNWELKKSDKKNELNGNIKSKKTTVKQIFLDYTKNPEKKSLEYLKKFLKKHNLRKWFTKTYSNWTGKRNSELIYSVLKFINDDRSSVDKMYWMWRTISWSSIGGLVLIVL